MVFARLILVAAAAACAAADHYHGEQRAAAASRLTRVAETTAQFWVDDAQAALRERERRGARDAAGYARNVVMFLGDGMSVPTLAAARTLLGQRRNQTGEEAELSFEQFPTTGFSKQGSALSPFLFSVVLDAITSHIQDPAPCLLMYADDIALVEEDRRLLEYKTYCVDAQIADSACSATAYLCGVKANEGTIGLTAAVPRFNCEASQDAARRVESIAEWALADGRDAGIVTTTRVTHASPAGMFAKIADRDWENDVSIMDAGHDVDTCPDIAYQLVHMHPGNKFKVILGGGRREFLPNTTQDEEGTSGFRGDGRNLIEEWQADKAARNVSYKYIWHKEELDQLASSPPEYLLGLFEGTHMQYHLEADPTSEPTLAELTEVAIRSLSRNERGFFLFVEGGRIDHAHHDNYPHLALDETIEMSEAVARAAELLSEEDSLIVVTADHAHVMAFNGYSPRGRDILGSSYERDSDNVPYMTLSYTNGPGSRAHRNGGIRVDVTQDSDFRALRWRAHVDAPLDSETHGGDDVAVFARGPHHALFSGLYEQSHLPHRMAYAACMGPGLHACSAAPQLHASRLAPLLLVLLAALFRF